MTITAEDLKETNELKDDDEKQENVPDATYEDLLPSLETETPVDVDIFAPRTRKKVRLRFVIKKSVSFPDIVESNKYSTSLEKGKMHMDFLNYIMKMWDKIIVKQPGFFKAELKKFKKDPALCVLDGMTMQTILTTVYGVFAEDLDETDLREHAVKN